MDAKSNEMHQLRNTRRTYALLACSRRALLGANANRGLALLEVVLVCQSAEHSFTACCAAHAFRTGGTLH